MTNLLSRPSEKFSLQPTNFTFGRRSWSVWLFVHFRDGDRRQKWRRCSHRGSVDLFVAVAVDSLQVDITKISAKIDFVEAKEARTSADQLDLQRWSDHILSLRAQQNIIMQSANTNISAGSSRARGVPL